MRSIFLMQRTRRRKRERAKHIHINIIQTICHNLLSNRQNGNEATVDLSSQSYWEHYCFFLLYSFAALRNVMCVMKLPTTDCVSSVSLCSVNLYASNAESSRSSGRHFSLILCLSLFRFMLLLLVFFIRCVLWFMLFYCLFIVDIFRTDYDCMVIL